MQQGVNFKFKKPFQTFDQHGVPVRKKPLGNPLMDLKLLV